MSQPPLHSRSAGPSSPLLPSTSPPMNGSSSPDSSSPPSSSVFVPPIPPGANYHTGAVDGHVTLLAAPVNASFLPSPEVASFLSPGALPILPRRFNDDVTDHALGGSAGPSPLRTDRPQRSVSTPQTPKLGPDAGNTGCAPAVESAAAAAALAAASANVGHVHRINRFAHIGGGHADDEAGERDAPNVPESRSLFEKDQNGVFQFASMHHKIAGAAALQRNRSKLNLATMSSPAGGGAGPRAPPIALVSAALSTRDLARSTSEENSFHPHGTAKLPYNRVLIDYAPSAPSVEHKEIASHVRKCLELRSKFVWTPLRSEEQYNVFDNPEYRAPSINDPMPPKHTKMFVSFEQGVFTAWHGEEDIDAKDNQIFAAPNRAEFGAAMATVMDFVVSGPVKTFCHNRLHILEARFNLHELLNHDIEQVVQKSVPHRDFYNVRKIDNHVHHSAAMNQKHLLRFIKAKLKKNDPEAVIVRDGKQLTLAQVFESLGLTAYDLNVDTLDMHADKTFHRFDKFNLKYNPVGECWAPGTQLLMYDGTVKSVDQIVTDSQAGLVQVLMTPSGPQSVIPGTAHQGHTQVDKDMWKGPALPAIKFIHSDSVGNAADSAGRLKQADGKFECKYVGCDARFDDADSRDAHEQKPALHSLRLESSPAMYRIRSADASRADLVVTGRHKLVVRFNTLPTGPHQWPDGSNAKPYYYHIVRVTKLNTVETAAVSFATEEQCMQALQAVRAKWTPLEWVGSVDEFNACSAWIRSQAQMYIPDAGIQFAPPAIALHARLELLLGRAVSQEFVRQTAWVLGMWLTDGHAASHTVTEQLEAWYAEAYAVPITSGITQDGQLPEDDVATVYSIRMGPLLRLLLQSYDMLSKKTLPAELSREARDVRLALLAGIIDGAGSKHASAVYEVPSKSAALLQQVAFLANSLGFSTGEIDERVKQMDGQEYSGYHVQISGRNLNELPVVLKYKAMPVAADKGMGPDPSCAGFTVGEPFHAPYFTFQLDGDGKCMLSNFVVTHNSRLREIFLKYNNFIKGKYLAEITTQVFDDLESNKYQFAEYRLSIYGREATEWNALAQWVVDHKLFSANIRWMIQIPRLYSIYKAAGQLKNFEEMLSNIFAPLFEVTIDPSSNPKLHLFLESCVGFDIVDDESLRERPYNDSLPTPDEWTMDYDPPYALFAYYVYANMITLNKLRSYRGFSCFSFRPHCGEAGDIEHLAAAFLLAKSINHGLMLQKTPALQYLYYLAQIGLSMSPLSNNLLFLEYEKNPFPKFFKKGLNVTLSTDDPLMIHVTREPLVEEYSVAAQVWKLSAIDMSEIARNSVLQSGFEQRFKSHWIGNSYWLRSLEGNDIRQTNVPDIRIQYRAELLGDEFKMLHHHCKEVFDESLVDRIM